MTRSEPTGSENPGPSSDQPAGLVPHPVLTDYYADEKRRRTFLNEIFDSTAATYDRTEKLIGFGMGSQYRRRALLKAGLAHGMRVVDVGVGTGLVARQAIRIVGDPRLVTGVDPSIGMMAHANLPEGVSLLQGTGDAIPLPATSADFLSMGFALRHLSSLDGAFNEFFRVMRPGGRLCLLEIIRPSNRTAQRVLKTYMKYLVPAVSQLWDRQGRTRQIWRYYWETIEACVDAETVMKQLRNAGFDQVGSVVECGIFCAYHARRPI